MFDTQSSPQSHHQEMLARLVQRLAEAGLQGMRSFDKRLANPDCADAQCLYYRQLTCEHHLVVLLVYGAGRSPVTLLSQGCKRHSQFSLVNTVQQLVDPELEAVITAALARVCSQQPWPSV